MRNVLRAVLAGVCLTLILTGTLHAQSQATTGVIEGTVKDETGGVLPGVTVTLRNTATNFTKVLITDGDGRFRGLLMPVGPYEVSAALAGFSTDLRRGVELGLGQTLSFDFVLTTSGVEEEIVVTAVAPVVDSTDVTGSTRIDQQAVSELPNNGRNFLDYMTLTPGVTIVQGPDGDEISVNGQKGIHNNISVDGADFNNPFFGEQRGGQRPPFTFNLDAIQEVVVVADGANAEFGRSSSGFVNVITKSGTNDLETSAHYFYKGDELSARAQNPDGTRQPEFDQRQQQAGFTVGGPAKQDELFYFVAVDAQDATSTKQTDPTRIEQRVVDLFAELGSPGENLPIDRTDDAFVGLAKLDWNASANQLASLRFVYTWSEQVNGTFDVDSWGRSANAIEKDFSRAFNGSLISTVRDNVLNEFRVQYAKEDRPRPYNGPNIAGTNRPFPDTAFDFGRGYRFGMPFFIPVDYYDERYQINDNLSYLMGRHTIKAGVEYNRTEAFQTFRGFGNGRFIFSSTDGFINYVNNPLYIECSDGSTNTTGVCPSGTEPIGPVLLYLQQAGVGGLTVDQAGTQTITQEEPAVFIQDTWQPLDNVTIDVGLRWEAQIQPDPITPPDEVFYADFIGTTSNGMEFPSNGKIPSDYDMWQPRFGIAWDPKGTGNTVIRASAGIYYSRVPGLNLASTRSTNGSRGQTLFRSHPASPFLGLPPAYDELLVPPDQVFFPDVFVFDKDFSNPRTTAYAIGVDQRLTDTMAVSLKFNYADGDNITRFINLNDPLLGSPWSAGLAPGGTNGINTLTVVQSSASSRYEGWTIGIQKRWSDNYQFQINYTYSEDRSDDDNERDPFTFRYAKITDLDAEWSWSDRDQRHRANAWFLWNAPYGIDLNLRYSYRSPQPKSLSCVVSEEFCGTDAFGNSRFMADAATPTDRINPDGSVTQRNLGRKDNRFSSLDFRLSKDFFYGETLVQPILDVFNVFDTENPLRPEVTNLIFNFDGTVQSGAGSPRQAQLGVRIVY